ncbi:bifunctional transcriptional activator/DNA repair enzyme AdaA [Deinococcus cellulosilyticus]|uniref:methylated-DNA--[protein]-cysteine S-methyltransferase n=1 Tax=Deinococcus cellulosilyticus (strain DSM 18568 / NBRC 106333 / KACC 11606 / 5516J-15) TaxID=1223518 RepID=A0A511N4G5_DEIC1|nr:methylated-DNA--[protein]-cysteine S-methyltransferase [Deinococcus cellulosilyticus]GEM47760.1 bifunctional transcriptional activator/DNA repair enzyme protein Ada [Deinococcus cellulosilyticus NBRC 106333 = KACC 11606]
MSSDLQQYEALRRHDLQDVLIGVRYLLVYYTPEQLRLLPSPEDLVFFRSVAEAEGAGYRPIPESLHLTERIAELLLAEPELTVQGLAERLDQTAHQVIRAFKKHTGMTPKQFAQLQKLERFREMLSEGQSITRSLYDAGFESLRALYERSSGFLGMQPRVYQQGGKDMTIAYETFETPFGLMLLAVTDLGVCSLQFGTFEDLLADLRQEYPKATLIEDASRTALYREAVLAYLRGETQTVEVALDVRGTDFQWKVWQALRRIPFGETRSYAQLASLIGEPKAVRAVAGACASNRLALIVPCHRIVRGDGSLSGYRWGPDRKREILDWEKR